MRRSIVFLALILLLSAAAAGPVGAELYIGGGIEYLRTLGDIKDEDEFDPNALGFIVSLLGDAGPIRLEGDLEWIPDFGGTGENLIQPQAYAMIGTLIYGGAGIGTGYFDGEWWEEPFYALRAGANLKLAGIDLDVFALYRFLDAEVLEELGESDLDSITFGAMIRFSLGRD